MKPMEFREEPLFRQKHFQTSKNRQNSNTVHDLKLSHFFQKKLQKSVTIWEYLPKGYHFWTIIKQKRKKL